MSRKVSGTWQGHPYYHWTVMIQGKRYRKSADDLGAERTKEGSVKQWMQFVDALRWGMKSEQDHQRIKMLSEVKQLALTASDDFERDELRVSESIIKNAKDHELNDIQYDFATVQTTMELAEQYGIVIPKDIDPSVASAFFGRQSQWEERKRLTKDADPDKQVAVILDKFIEEIKLTEAKGHTTKELAAWVALVKKENLPLTSIAAKAINEDTVDQYWRWLLSKKYSPNAHNKRLGFFRRFVSWCRTKRHIETEPLNLKVKHHRRKERTKAVKTFENVWNVVNALPEDKRLWAMLGLNTGMTQTDLGKLKWSDIKNGILTRKRSKTEDHPEVPTVQYRLWPETLALLNTVEKTHDLVFTSEDNTPMHSATKDLFYQQWQRMAVACPITLAKFRSIGSSALKTDKHYREYVDLFLGHSASSIADKHYSAEAWKPFYEATDYIRKYLKEQA